ncbi:hypothetical protein GCM10010112_42860 [Actinoplanes lobatus]|uniref:Uncharacterized protein n=1 Tax=Actinoplanes lobatus TaxID=113568 RepID=A0A7W7HBY2_9ACTN|nr:hypothetical protein [Actinoplanes lobatus]MBB4747671.1 hypothetical protein [Actinoplanes lobatus]GGN73506.1 hypothetical protein GCM10010112_42860 [Actinoplanes lobatus]GIE39765.1 hypothetical protein Alo02nite_26630 [Actinoplanes lobatus]
MFTLLSRSLITTAVSAAVLVSTTGSAIAATNTLTVTAVNRSGAKVSIAANVINVSTNVSYTIRTGKARKLPKGSYAVLAAIPTGYTTTLGGKPVKVSGSTKLTLDARYGKPVNLGISPAVTGLEKRTQARLCVDSFISTSVEGYGSDDSPVYVIPTASKKIQFAAMGTWTNALGSGDSYAVVHRSNGVPSTPSRAFKRASLGTVTVDSRRGTGIANYNGFAVQPQDGCATDLYSNLFTTEDPTYSKVHLTPGNWHLRSDSQATTSTGEGWNVDSLFASRKVAAGKPAFVRFNGAATGPGYELPTVIRGRMNYSLDDMFTDPGFRWSGDPAKVVATLKTGGKTVKTRKVGTYGVYGPQLEYWVKKAGWYTLSVNATRYYPGITLPSGMLSTASGVVFRFPAKPDTSVLPPLFTVQHVPAGLNNWNRAKAGSTTNVAIRLNRAGHDTDAKRGANPKLKSLSTKISTDGGRTWRSVPVRKINGVWHAIVPNPASGAVSLRTRATYTNGGYTEATVFRAYAIG